MAHTRQAEYVFVATYGNYELKANDFGAIGDELLERGFVMEQATPVEG